MSYYTQSEMLANIANVDLVTTGQTTLMTVPSGVFLFITDVIICITSADTATVGASIAIGKTASYDHWIGNTSIASLNAVGEFISLASASLLPIHTMLEGGDVLKLDVRTGATAVSLRAQVMVFGCCLI